MKKTPQERNTNVEVRDVPQTTKLSLLPVAITFGSALVLALAALVLKSVVGFGTVFYVLIALVFAAVCGSCVMLAAFLGKDKPAVFTIGAVILFLCAAATVAAVVLNLSKDNNTAMYMAAAATGLGVLGVFLLISGVPGENKETEIQS